MNRERNGDVSPREIYLTVPLMNEFNELWREDIPDRGHPVEAGVKYAGARYERRQ